MDSNRRQFFFPARFADPNSGFPRLASRCNCELRRRANHGLFQRPHIPHHIAPDRAQIQNRIAHNLSRPVIGDISAARGLKIFHAFLPQNSFAGQQVGALPAAPQRDHMRMLAKQQHIFNRAGLPRRHHALLQLQSLGISDKPQIDLQTAAHAQRRLVFTGHSSLAAGHFFTR